MVIAAVKSKPPNRLLPHQLSVAPQNYCPPNTLTSHKQHLTLLLHRPHFLTLISLLILIDNVNRLFHISKN